jgi:hypothetical protein
MAFDWLGVQLSRGKSAYAVHREDACQFSFCQALKNRSRSMCWKVTESLRFLGVAKGRDPCRTQSLRQGKPPSARYGGHGSGGDNAAERRRRTRARNLVLIVAAIPGRARRFWTLRQMDRFVRLE